MPTEARFDVRKGVNTAASPEALSQHEVRRAKNMVLTKHGALVTRGGSKRIHSIPFTSTPRPSITQLIKTADGIGLVLSLNTGVGNVPLHRWYTPVGNRAAILYRKLDNEPEFQSDPWLDSGDTVLITPMRFARWRIGSQVVIVKVDKFYGVHYWDGTTWTTATSSPPCVYARPYKGRLYVAGDPNNPKRFYGCKINDLSEWGVGAGAVLGDAEQYDHDPINGLATVGSSLLILKEDAVQRWSGVAATDFNLERDSEGVSRQVGCIAPETIEEVEHLVMFLSELGPIAASEGGVQAFGEQLADQWRRVNRTHLPGSVSQWNPATHEYRLYLPMDSEISPETGWYYNQLLGAWTGPHQMRTLENGVPVPLGPTAMALYELPSGEALTMFGADDGFVRIMDNGVHLDDVLADGTGGVPIEWEVEYPTLHFGSLAYEKDLDALTVAMQLPPGQQATVYWQVDSEDEESVVIDGIDEAPQNYYVGRLPSVGRRIRLGLRGEATTEVAVLGFELEADILRRT